jgi:PAS domain S-box-containing protein
MTDSDDTAGEGDESDEPAVRILHLDPDETVRSRLRAVVGETDGADYEGMDVIDRERLVVEPADVLVVEPDAPEDVLDLVTAVASPVVLYTGADPTEIAAEVLDAADTLVEKWTAQEGLEFVVEKILATVRSDERSVSRFTPAFEQRDEDAQSSASFLVYDDGTVIWESTSLETLFDRRDVTVTLPDVPNFYKQLSAALTHDPEAVRTVRGTSVRDQPTRFTVPAAGGDAHFRYSEHEFPETLGPLRLVVVEDVTWSERSATRFELLDLLDRHVQDGISVVDANGRVEYHNESFADLLGYDDMVGEHAATFMAEGELKAGQQLIQRLRASDRDSGVTDMTLKTKDGAERTVAVHFSVRGSGDEYEGLVNVARDVTDRRDRERTLEQYRRLVESAGDPMYVVDDEGCVATGNDALASLVDRSRESLVGTELTDLFPDEAIEHICAALERTTGDTSATSEIPLTVADGEVRQFEATVARLGDADPSDNAAGSVGILHEVAEREIAETIVDRSEDLVETTEKARAIERVIDSDEGQVTADLRSIVNRGVANVSAAHSEASYDVQITDQLPVRVHRAFPYAVENLIENALTHCDDGASVTVAATTQGDTVTLWITDDGPAIPEDELEVFENREETPLEHGTGVGLRLVNWVVDRSSGDLEFDTGPDGTTVTVRLDAGDAADIA